MEEVVAFVLHKYVKPAPPLTFAESVVVLPLQMLVVPAMVTVGVGLTTTVVATVGLEHPLSVVNTEYVPAAAVVTDDMIGFCRAEEKVFGPVQE
jgi:hypothetical protein